MENKIILKCPGCQTDIFLDKESFYKLKQISSDLYEKIVNSQYCSGQCARNVIGQKDPIFKVNKNE